MLTASQIDVLRSKSEQLLDPVTDFLIEDIAKRIAEAGQLTGTASYQVWKLQQMGVSQKQLKKEIAKRLKVSQKEAENLLTQAAETGYNFDLSRFPTSHGIPLSANSSLQQILDATVKLAKEDLSNMTQTIGFVGPDGVCRELTQALLDGTLYKENAWSVQIIARDTVGEETVVTVAIPSEAVFQHKRAGGKGLGLGGYCDEDELLDVHWNIRGRQDMQIDGAVNANNYGGLFIQTVRLSGTNNLQVQTRWESFSGDGGSRQSIFLFGYDNGLLVRGIIGISNSGSVQWDGTSGVTVTADSATGIITVTLPALAYDHFVLFSATPITAV